MVRDLEDELKDLREMMQFAPGDTLDLREEVEILADLRVCWAPGGCWGERLFGRSVRVNRGCQLVTRCTLSTL